MTDPAFKSDFLKTLQARGYIHQITHPDDLDLSLIHISSPRDCS